MLLRNIQRKYRQYTYGKCCLSIKKGTATPFGLNIIMYVSVLKLGAQWVQTGDSADKKIPPYCEGGTIAPGARKENL